MRQTFPLTDPRHKQPQAVALLKNRIRKYLTRERRKSLPEGYDYWDFDCRAGDTEETAAVVHVKEILGRIDVSVSNGSPTVYLELLAKPQQRTRRDAAPEPSEAPPSDETAQE